MEKQVFPSGQPLANRVNDSSETPSFEVFSYALISTLERLEQNHYQDFDNQMDHLMERLGRFLAAGRCAIFRHIEENDLLEIVYKWYSDTGAHTASFGEVSGKKFMPWVIRSISESGYLFVRDVAQMDASAVLEKQTAAKRGFKAFMIVPIQVQNQLLGYLNISSLTPNPDWDERTLYALQHAAYIFGNALYRKEIGKNLEDQESRMRLAIDGSGAGIWEITFDPAHGEPLNRSIYLSAQMRSILDWQVETSLVKLDDWEKQIFADDRGQQEALMEMLARGEIDNMKSEFRIQDRDGNIRWIYTQGKLVHDHKGRPLKATGFAWDITDRKQAEKEREILIAELEEKNAALEQFTYTVSHDLKSPLITIQGYSGYIQSDLKNGNTERAMNDLKRIERAVDKMAHLLDDLLELSRVGHMVAMDDVFSLSDPLTEALELLRGNLADRKVDIQIEPSLICIKGDRQRIRAVWQNVLENALKFTRHHPNPRIEIGMETKVMQGKERRSCYIRDNGIGIEPEFQHKVFNLFERLHPQYKGSGIGLTLVKRIVELHNGQIWLESEGKNKGTTFYFYLPEIPN